MPRTDDELRELSGHVLWHVRQLCRLGGHVVVRERAGEAVQEDALDAAALEAFLVHLRALREFLWRSRSDDRPPWKTDGLAEDYFWDSTWKPVHDRSVRQLRDECDRIGRDLVHVSFKRLAPEAWGLDVDRLAAVTYIALLDFAFEVNPSRVVDGFAATVKREFLVELHLDPTSAHEAARVYGHSVGTPRLDDWLPGATA